MVLSVACGLGILICSNGIAYKNMSSNHPAAFFICSCKYCSMVTRVLYMYLMFCVISLPGFVAQMMYDQLPWLLPLASSLNPCVLCPLSFHCIVTVDPAEKKFFMSIFVLNIFLLMGLEGLILCTIFININRT